MRQLSSFLIWTAVVFLILLWLPVLAIVRLFDRNPVRYRTGRMFRNLGVAISRVNPNWNVSLEGYHEIDDRYPYVIVSNHLSNADIPVISNLPWEMKWVAKKELFELPVVGWMMKMAGDIPVDRKVTGRKVQTVKKCREYLKKNISVIFFPEGTRSRDGEVKRFARGAFEIAIKEKVPVLPIAIDGTQGCLPKNTWVFKPDVYAKLKVLEPVDTTHYSDEDIDMLLEEVRGRIIGQLAEWRKDDL